MNFSFFSRFKSIDWLLIVAVFLLICFGLVSLYSLALSQTEQTTDNFNFLNKQIVFSIIGLVLLFVFMFFDYRWWQHLSIWLYGLSLVLLILVLFFGQKLKGTTGWFVVGNFSFQPVELAKLAVVLFLARCFEKWSADKYQLKIWLKSFLIILPPCLLAILQPDFGAVLVIIIIWFGMLWLSGINKKHLLVFVAILILISILSWQFVLHDYHRERILTFLNPLTDPLGTGYNTRQSIIAIGSGGWLGRGLSLGTQSQLHFLPVSEADFIFAALGEELGFLAVTFILLLYLLIFYRIFKIMKNTKHDFALFLISGLYLIFGIQFLINVGMTIGLVPVTGLSLPFVSYGGSFLLVSLIGVGIIESIKIREA